MKGQLNINPIFYQEGMLTNVSEGAQQRTIFRSTESPLAEQHTAGGNGLLATDGNSSVLITQSQAEVERHIFSAYGHDTNARSGKALLGFNGELVVRPIEKYLLGTGYHRTYSPTLMRFLSADILSPFELGGLNSYAYCGNDPINKTDPSGHFSITKLITGKYRSSYLEKRQTSEQLNTIDDIKNLSYTEREYAILSRHLQRSKKLIDNKHAKYERLTGPKSPHQKRAAPPLRKRCKKT